MHRPIARFARFRASAFLLTLLFLIAEPLVHGAATPWTNPGNSSSTFEWGLLTDSVIINTNQRVGGFLFPSGGGTFIIDASFGASGSLTFTASGVVNETQFVPTFHIINNGYILFAGLGSSLGYANYQVDVGSLRIRTDSNIDGSLALVTLNGGSLVSPNVADSGIMTIGAIQGSGIVSLGSSTLTVGGRGIDTTFSGEIGGGLDGVTTLTKVGTGTWTLSGANSYAGNTLISAGTIKITNTTGSAFSSGDVTIAHGAMLTGAGSFTGALNNSGTFSPGNSPTLMTLSAFNQDVNGETILELGGLARGTGYDALNITGAAAFDGALTLSLINGFTPASGDSFNLFDWGSLTGTFATLNLPSLTSGLSWDTSMLYTDGTLSVTGTAIPEPADYAALAGGALVVFALWRRRTASASAAAPSSAA